GGSLPGGVVPGRRFESLAQFRQGERVEERPRELHLGRDEGLEARADLLGTKRSYPLEQLRRVEGAGLVRGQVAEDVGRVPEAAAPSDEATADASSAMAASAAPFAAAASDAAASSSALAGAASAAASTAATSASAAVASSAFAAADCPLAAVTAAASAAVASS